jgi:oxygen-independent coproporphyrinogen-3 oxidase
MSSIYFHIPFCKQACIYCNFHFSTVLKSENELVDAMMKELDLQKNFFRDGKSTPDIKTLYFGGGTPSLLPVSTISKFLEKANGLFHLSPHAEITLEANPDDLDKEKLKSLKEAGINRLSIGIQSFFDEDLQWMNRAHNGAQALQCIEDAREAGFDHLSADLIFGMPALTDKRLEENIAQMTALAIPHLSCYALTLEPHTPLDHFIKNKKDPPLSEVQAARQFEIVMNMLQAAGYEQYEISNFAKPGMRSQHNSSYWKGESYLGIGPSAHSFTGRSRHWNVANNAKYIRSLEQNIIPWEEEILTDSMQLNEYIMTSLRRVEGCDLNIVSEKWGKAESKRLKAEGEKFILMEQMILKNNHLILTLKGKLFADGIASELFR